ncbi:TIGR02269 family lipoprotein [Archangium sp.]|uniref:SitA6 family polymorphic toxin lipoprotein n=1 Tax=Archangium sp. TaxID=1872627 RepID=UPI00286AE08B|nr:TIGR02269 family lipoprotein [Archangium sp.]
MSAIPKPWLGLLCTLLTACATSSPSLQDVREPPPEVVSSWEEGCADERTVVLLCREDGDECGFFRCQEVAPREVLLAYRGGGPIYIPGASPAAPRRWWRNPRGWPRNTEPVLTFRFNRHLDPKPPALVPVLPPGRWVRHHLLPQAEDLARWFHRQGVPDIHQFTLLIPEHIHLRIHSGGPSGGLWNAAWRQFQRANEHATPAEIYRHAGELIFRFELTGPIVPYSRRR